MTKDHFPGAPSQAYVSEEGWLVYRAEAWTPEDWAATPPHRRPHDRARKPSPVLTMPQRGRRYASDAERREAQRASNRAYMRRTRAEAR